MYELPDYLAMIDDHRRVSAFRQALRETVRPTDVVLEIGTGFGYFAIEAALLGARHVWALEPNDVIDIGRSLAVQHGVGDRITFIQAESLRFDLPERADVLLEDIRGVSPLLAGRLFALRDARDRLLRADARWITLRDHLFVAPADESGAHTLPDLTPSGGDAASVIDLGAVRERARNAIRRVDPQAVDLRAVGQCWATIEPSTLGSMDASGRVRFSCTSSGIFRGWATWFETDLAGGAMLSSSPERGDSVYRCGWLALPHPVSVGEGDSMEIRLLAIHDGTDYVWSWDTVITPVGSTLPRHQFRQTDLAARMLSAERRTRRAASTVPTRGPELELHADLLGSVDGVKSLEGIASRVQAKFPHRFADEQEALAWVGRTLARLVE